ncbi:MAG: DUF1611 domain-containing protein [Haliscomenobacter sp.]|nr:DUF1611 domain-containing protein [Haliscomenobacter sp.]
MKPKALILTNGILLTPNAKTAHGLIRGTDRFDIAGVVDPECAGQDAGTLLDGQHRHIPVIDTLENALLAVPDASHLIVGVATVGGVFPGNMLEVIETGIRHRLSIVNGLHDYLSDRPNLAELASEYGVSLIDIRKPKKREDLHFWTGEIYQVKCPIVAVLGMDCAMGKRTTARMLKQACEAAGMKAQMIYTGQTGWLQGGEYGFIFDSTLNDFVSGELEHAIVSCWNDTQPDVIFLEGQSALRNPSGPCGLEFLISGNARKVVLLHAPKRKYYDHDPHWGEIPSVESEIGIYQKFGAQVIALALHTEDCTAEEACDFQKAYQQQLGIPVLLPLQEGVGELVEAFRR